MLRPLLPALLALLPAVATSAQPRLLDGALAPSDARLDSGEFYDTYEVEAEPGSLIEVDLTSEAFDTYLAVVAPSGDVEENDDTGGTTRSYLRVGAEEGGRFRVVVTSYAAGETGPYRLSVSGGRLVEAPSPAQPTRRSPNTPQPDVPQPAGAAAPAPPLGRYLCYQYAAYVGWSYSGYVDLLPGGRYAIPGGTEGRYAYEPATGELAWHDGPYERYGWRGTYRVDPERGPVVWLEDEANDLEIRCTPSND